MSGPWTNQLGVNQANVGITGGTITGTNVPYVLSQSGIPFVGLSSGSVAANGAISGITALPFAYPKAYCYFPANILATTIAAGWYYCTFSTTTAGTAFLDTYTAGNPTIPTSPTAVTDGKGAFTGDTGEEFGPTITIPAGALGANGSAEIFLSQSNNNSAGTKFIRVRYSGQAGTQIFGAQSVTTNTFARHDIVMSAQGVTNAQKTTSTGWQGGSTAFMQVQIASAIDTTAATTLVVSFQRNTATDNIVLEHYRMRLSYGA